MLTSQVSSQKWEIGGQEIETSRRTWPIAEVFSKTILASKYFAFYHPPTG
jgi:hypothetical protein